MSQQNQNIDGSKIENSQIQLVQAREAVSFNNSHGNQVTITNVILRLFGQPESATVDWEWAQQRLEKEQLTEIRKRLTDTLGRDRYLLSIGLEEQLSWVGRSPLQANRRLLVKGEDQGSLDMSQLLIETFGRDDINGKLLILGTPGAGKTTALLSLAEQLVVGAIAKPKTVIPILFELSTWRDDNQSIQDWLIEQLYDLYKGDRKAKRYEQWLERQVLLPLLDGLDELGLERQQKCTANLNEFARYYPHLVVCCRVKEFEQANLKLSNLNGAVCLEPLSNNQIQTYLDTIQCPQLWSAIQTNPALHTLLEPTNDGEPGLLRVPLFLNLAVHAYDPSYLFRTKGELLELYIERQLSRDVRESDRRKRIERKKWEYPTPQQEPGWQHTQATLNWLARQLQASNTVELLIERIQPRWLETKLARLRYQLILGLILGLLGGLMYGLMYRLFLGLFGGLLGGLILGLFRGLDSIEPLEASKMSMSPKGRLKILAGLRIGLIFGLWLGLIFGLFGGLIFGLFGGLIGGLIIGLIFGLIRGLKEDLQLRSRPNQGIWNSLQSMVWTTVLGYPLGITFANLAELSNLVANGRNQGDNGVVILAAVWAALPKFLIPGIFGALFFGFVIGGGLACIQHLCLRLVLWQSGIAPWNLARFLNYCVERRLLQRVGGRYRFLHRELLDHFAQTPHP